MKRLTAIAVLTLFLGSGSLALAKSKSGGPASGSHPRAKAVSIQARDQKTRINKDVAAGKLTKDQAEDLKDALRSVTSQLSADMRLNHGNDLNVGQEQQLDQLLEANSKKIAAEEK